MDNNSVFTKKIAALSGSIKNILETGRVCLIEAVNDEYAVYNSVRKINDTIKMVLLNLDMERGDAIEILKETRQRFELTPIVIFTTESSRSFFIEAMLQGATECVVKPFKEDALSQTLSKYLMPGIQQKETVTFDLSRYLKGELKKAEKGHYAVSAMVMALSLKNGAEPYDIKSNTAGNILYENLKELFWETDAFIRFASKYYLGVFPFCDEKNTQIISRKIQNSFEELREEYKLLNYFDLVTVYVSYPYDIGESAKIYELLLARIKERMKEQITAII